MLQRYTLEFVSHRYNPENEMVPCDTGEYVRYEDVENLIQTILQLKPIIEKLEDDHNDR